MSIDVLTSLGQYIKTSVWDFSVMTEQNKVNKLFIMDLSLQSIKTNNWPADNFKKHHLNELYFWAVIQSGDTGQWMPFLTAVNWP